MAKKKNKSEGKSSIVLSIIALLISSISIYIQFFYETTNLQIGSIHLSDVSDTTFKSKRININLLLLNTGTNPIAFTEWYSFLSTDKSLPNNSYSFDNIIPNNTAIYTCCHSNINTIIKPNTAEFVDLNISIKDEKLYEYLENNENDKNPYLNLGVHITFVDSNGKKVTKELIVGASQFNNNHTWIRTPNQEPERLEIY